MYYQVSDLEVMYYQVSDLEVILQVNVSELW